MILARCFLGIVGDPTKCIENADCKCCYVVEKKNATYGESPGTEVLLALNTFMLCSGFSMLHTVMMNKLNLRSLFKSSSETLTHACCSAQREM